MNSATPFFWATMAKRLFIFPCIKMKRYKNACSMFLCSNHFKSKEMKAGLRFSQKLK